jgi:hypothetical protein
MNWTALGLSAGNAPAMADLPVALRIVAFAAAKTIQIPAAHRADVMFAAAPADGRTIVRRAPKRNRGDHGKRHAYPFFTHDRT